MVHCHPNARLTPRGRAAVFVAVEAGMTVVAACLAFNVSRRCYYRWLPRWCWRHRCMGMNPPVMAALNEDVDSGWRAAG